MDYIISFVSLGNATSNRKVLPKITQMFVGACILAMVVAIALAFSHTSIAYMNGKLWLVTNNQPTPGATVVVADEIGTVIYSGSGILKVGQNCVQNGEIVDTVSFTSKCAPTTSLNVKEDQAVIAVGKTVLVAAISHLHPMTPI